MNPQEVSIDTLSQGELELWLPRISSLMWKLPSPGVMKHSRVIQDLLRTQVTVAKLDFQRHL